MNIDVKNYLKTLKLDTFVYIMKFNDDGVQESIKTGYVDELENCNDECLTFNVNSCQAIDYNKVRIYI